ncbi:FtsB family cell division protein [Candidatus Methylacidithermus pantelleriae]|uniref:Septum formation initiator n=1 Tax=Candidatus Methylacidithermus pantelleriae TaxID=2744239 RepID=A0A8J2BJ92_9BACT|nr:septum formation initiator family protein [Candidatus Methylacidithermus pantelleriae]CAF0689208.1 hypothetical protein MPNT_10146 [Candidatus Methylacidithermus pantelleriae]
MRFMRERYRYRYASSRAVEERFVRSGGVWRALTQVCKVVCLAAVAILVMSFYLPLIQKLQELENRKGRLEEQIHQARTRSQELEYVFRLLKTDPDFVERMARDRLNMGKPGETIFRFEPYPVGPSPILPLLGDPGLSIPPEGKNVHLDGPSRVPSPGLP